MSIYSNLDAELSRYRLNAKYMAKSLNIALSTYYSKVGGYRDFKLGEMMKVKEVLDDISGLDMELEYIFYKNPEKK